MRTLLTVCVIFQVTAADYLDINGCFSQRPGFEVSVKANEIQNTQSVQMKDECLRACLRSMVDRGGECKSIMHMPMDNECVISSAIGTSVGRTDEKSHNNYYENECAKMQPGGRIQARLLGYRGGQGILEMAQQKGHNPKIMVVMTGLAPGRDYNLFYAPQLEATMCQKMTSAKKADIGEKLITVDSDTTGMAIQPWTDIDWHILDDNVLGKTVVVVESQSGLVVDCGSIKIKGNQSDWEAAKNFTASNYSLSVFCLLLTIFAILFVF